MTFGKLSVGRTSLCPESMFVKRTLPCAARIQQSKYTDARMCPKVLTPYAPPPNPDSTDTQYMKIFMGICKMLNPAMEYEEALEIVQNDFERDAKGADSLDYSKFYDAVFELVDKWTIDISAQEYVAFLKTLLSRMQ